VRRLTDEEFRYVARGFEVSLAAITIAPLVLAPVMGRTIGVPLVMLSGVTGILCLLSAGATIAQERRRRHRIEES